MDQLLDKAISRLAPFCALDMDYERWCAAFGLDRNDPKTSRAFDKLLALYPQVWTAMGTDAFFAALEPKLAWWAAYLR